MELNLELLDKNQAYQKALLFLDKTSHDYSLENAIKCLKHSSKLGNPEASFLLGKIYSEGIHCKPRLTKAIKWYDKAHKQRHSSAGRELTIAKAKLRKSLRIPTILIFSIFLICSLIVLIISLSGGSSTFQNVCSALTMPLTSMLPNEYDGLSLGIIYSLVALAFVIGTSILLLIITIRTFPPLKYTRKILITNSVLITSLLLSCIIGTIPQKNSVKFIYDNQTQAVSYDTRKGFSNQNFPKPTLQTEDQIFIGWKDQRGNFIYDIPKNDKTVYILKATYTDRYFKKTTSSWNYTIKDARENSHNIGSRDNKYTFTDIYNLKRLNYKVSFSFTFKQLNLKSLTIKSNTGHEKNYTAKASYGIGVNEAFHYYSTHDITLEAKYSWLVWQQNETTEYFNASSETFTNNFSLTSDNILISEIVTIDSYTGSAGASIIAATPKTDITIAFSIY